MIARKSRIRFFYSTEKPQIYVSFNIAFLLYVEIRFLGNKVDKSRTFFRKNLAYFLLQIIQFDYIIYYNVTSSLFYR